MMLEYIKAIIYGIVEGITEWLPVSSTGHLILLEGVIPLNVEGSLGESFAEQYRAMFDVVVQLAAILAVLCLYFKKLNPFSKSKKEVLGLWGRLVLATVPAALIGLAADKLCELFLGCNLDTLLFKPQIVACALIVYGIIFILVERLTKTGQVGSDQITNRHAIAIGCFQSLAIIPGTSRSGATILGARILGIPRASAAEFSFFAAIPVIASASLLKIFDFGKYTYETGIAIPLEAILILLIAGISAFAVSMLTIKFLTDFVKRHSFASFGIYRIVLGIAVLIFIK